MSSGILKTASLKMDPRFHRILRVGVVGFFVAAAGVGLAFLSPAVRSRAVEVVAVALVVAGFGTVFVSVILAFAVGLWRVWTRACDDRANG